MDGSKNEGDLHMRGKEPCQCESPVTDYFHSSTVYVNLRPEHFPPRPKWQRGVRPCGSLMPLLKAESGFIPDVGLGETLAHSLSENASSLGGTIINSSSGDAYE